MTEENKKLDEQEFIEKHNLSWDFENWSLKKLVLVHKRYKSECNEFDDFYYELTETILQRLHSLVEKKS